MLTTNDIAELVGVPQERLLEIMRHADVEPAARGGPGRGQTHRFDLPASVALAYGASIREWGAKPAVVWGAASFIANAGTPELWRWLEEGVRIVFADLPLCAPDDTLIPPLLDFAAIFRRVNDRYQDSEKAPKPQTSKA
jgi:hypothetical protein